MRPRILPALAVLSTLAALSSTGCSIRKLAITKVGDALAESGTSFASDDDPELIREAMPFTLKLIESILEQNPKHEGLLTAAAGGFTQYAWAFVQQDADEIEETDFERARALRIRARNLYMRAHRYGVRGLTLAHPGFDEMLAAEPGKAAMLTTRQDVPLVYWTAASLLASIALSKDDPDRLAQLPIVEALMSRALALDPDYSHGALHELMISYDGARSDAMGGSAARARGHFRQAMDLSAGQRASPLVSLAEMVSVREQNRPEFLDLLNQALAVDPNARPEWRLENLLMQKRARWLIARADLLFAD